MSTVFEIEGSACPQLLGRLIGLFAQQHLVPDRVEATRAGETLAVRIAAGPIDPARAAIIEHKMRAIVAVGSVRTAA